MWVLTGDRMVSVGLVRGNPRRLLPPLLLSQPPPYTIPQETAVNIGYACRLLTDGAPRTEIAPRGPPPPPGTPLDVADAALHADVAAQLAAALAESAECGSVRQHGGGWWRRRRESPQARAPHPHPPRSLVVDGAALGALLCRPADADALVTLALRSPTVIFCRVSPLQKATIAK